MIRKRDDIPGLGDMAYYAKRLKAHGYPLEKAREVLMKLDSNVDRAKVFELVSIAYKEKAIKPQNSKKGYLERDDFDSIRYVGSLKYQLIN